MAKTYTLKTKTCTKCGETKSKKEFYPNHTGYGDGLEAKCSTCSRHLNYIYRSIREGKITRSEVENMGFATVSDTADHLRELFKVVSMKDKAVNYLKKMGYTVSETTLDRYIGSYGQQKHSLVAKGVSRSGNRDNNRYTWENNKEEAVLLEVMAIIQGELRDVYGLNFDKHHLIPQSDGGTFNVTNLRLIPSKINKWIEDDYYTEEEITEKIDANSNDRRFKPYAWSKCLPVEEFAKLFVEVYSSLPKA